MTPNESCSSSIAKSMPTCETFSGRAIVTGAKFRIPSIPTLTQSIGYALRCCRGDGQQAELNVMAGHDFRTRRPGSWTVTSFDLLTRLGRIAVECGDDVESLLQEAFVPQQRPAQVSHPD